MNWLHNAYRTMPNPPIYDNKVRFERSVIKDLSVMGGIDIGSTLAKFAFVEKDTDLNADYIPLRCTTYHNEDFLNGLVMMKERAELPVSGTIHCTGSGTAVSFDQIKQVLGLDIFFVPENIANRRGLFLALQFAKHEDVVYPMPPFKSWIYSSTYLDDFYQENPHRPLSRQIRSLLPAGVISIGSCSTVALMNVSGVTKFLGFIPLGGKSFMGLANLLLGRSNYEEITTLASKGRREKVDTQFRDLFESSDTAYGQFPPSLPVFSFGKVTHKSWNRHNVSRADLASSLLTFFSTGLMMTMMNISLATGIKRFYVCGNFSRAEIVRSLIMEAGTIIKCNFDVRFISLGHCGVIGTMLSTAEDTPEKWIVNDIDI